MQPRCTCTKEITGWYFNFNKEDPKFDRGDIIGERLIAILRKLKKVTYTNASISKMLHNIETKPDLRKWFLYEIKHQTHKTCYGWQCKMKVIKISKSCKIHSHNKKQISKEGKK